ncbi:hypothetical protein ACTL6U_07640 [Rhodovibrionaceae bacterium A322]
MLIDAQHLTNSLQEMDRTNAPAVSLDLLSAGQSAELTAAAQALSYRAGKDQVGSGDKAVYQDFLLTADWPETSPVTALKQELEDLFQKAQQLTSKRLLPAGFTFNDHMALFYPSGSKGITPHRDMTRFAGVILLLTLSGKASFITSRDRAAQESVVHYDLLPGRLILLRGTEFGTQQGLKSIELTEPDDDRPFHAVTRVDEDRYCLGFRYDKTM